MSKSQTVGTKAYCAGEVGKVNPHLVKNFTSLKKDENHRKKANSIAESVRRIPHAMLLNLQAISSEFIKSLKDPFPAETSVSDGRMPVFTLFSDCQIVKTA